MVSNTIEPGASLENVVAVSSSTADSNPTNNSATADTNILGSAAFAISKRQVAPTGSVNAGGLVTYTVTITNSGPGLACL